MPIQAEGSARSFFERLFPADLVSYIPGAKFIAGAIVYAAANWLGATGDVVNVLSVDVNVPEVAAFVGFYLWPSR